MCNKGEHFALKTANEVIYRPLFKKKKKKKTSLVGCAIQFCAPLTDWNIPHRGLASLLQDSCLFARRKKLLLTIDLGLLIDENGLYTYGYFTHLQDNLIPFFM